MTDYLERVRVDHESEVPVYQQIADIIHTRIERGRATGIASEESYPPGSLIPSIERIRQETGCAVKTIRHGIAVLAADGLVVIVPGKGTFVKRD
jgi:DNA-binding GntR family transcriptional regulator